MARYGASCYQVDMPRRRRIISFLRQRDWPGMLFELLIVAIGVMLGIQANDWNAKRAQARRTALIAEGMRQDLRDGYRFEEMAVAEVNDGLARFDAARARGERPPPYVFRIPGGETPPDTMWQATLQTGLSDLIDPKLLFDLGLFYSEREGIGVRYVRYSRFVEDEVLPKTNDPAQFYDARGVLKPEYAANMDRLREWRFYLLVTIRTAHCLDARFAHPDRPGPSCRADYGPLFTPRAENSN
jgi:hypothetical protein